VSDSSTTFSSAKGSSQEIYFVYTNTKRLIGWKNSILLSITAGIGFCSCCLPQLCRRPFGGIGELESGILCLGVFL
jgi:hypothetical protein